MMATTNTKLVLNNYATRDGATPSLKSPLPTDDGVDVAANLLVNDRNVRWTEPGTGALENVIIDVGAGKSYSVLGFLGLERAPGGLFPNQFYVYGANTYPAPNVSGCTANGTITVTRASGSFITDGVKVGQVIALSGSGVTVPGGTTVLTVSALSLTMTAAASGSGTVTVSTTDEVSLTPVLSVGGVRDFAVELGAPVTYRFLRFVMGGSVTPYSLGKFLAGRVLDFGFAYGPGSTDALEVVGASNRSVSGLRTFTRTGPDQRRFGMRFPNATQAQRDALFAAAAQRQFTMLHPTFGVCDVQLANDAIEAAHLLAAPDLFDITLNVETLP